MPDIHDAPTDEVRCRSGEIFGLAVALGLTTLFWWPPIASRLLPQDLVWRNVVAQAVDWLFCIVLIGVVLFWERRPLSSLGFKPLSIQSFSAGLGLGGFVMVGIVLWRFTVAPLIPDVSFPTGGAASSGKLTDHFLYWWTTHQHEADPFRRFGPGHDAARRTVADQHSSTQRARVGDRITGRFVSRPATFRREHARTKVAARPTVAKHTSPQTLDRRMRTGCHRFNLPPQTATFENTRAQT